MVSKLCDLNFNDISFQSPSSLGAAGKKVGAPLLRPEPPNPDLPPLRLESTLQSFRPLVSYHGHATTFESSKARTPPSCPSSWTTTRRSESSHSTPTSSPRSTSTRRFCAAPGGETRSRKTTSPPRCATETA